MTGRTGYTAKANTDTFQPPADMAAIYAWFDALIDFSVATSSSLPTSGNFKGKQAIAEDTGLLWWHNGTAWVQVGASAPHFVLKKSSAYPFSSGSYADHTWDTSLSEGSLTGFTTSDWVTFTCTLGGLYLFNLHLTATTGGTSANVALLKNGSVYREDNTVLSSSAWTSLIIPASMRLAAGDTFKMQTSGSGGTGISDVTKNYCSVDYLHA